MFKSINPELSATLTGIFGADIAIEILRHYYAFGHPAAKLIPKIIYARVTSSFGEPHFIHRTNYGPGHIDRYYTKSGTFFGSHAYIGGSLVDWHEWWNWGTLPDMNRPAIAINTRVLNDGTIHHKRNTISRILC